MRTSFVQIADVRLGYRDPFNADSALQIAEQFGFIVDFSIEQRASFVIISGNLFDSPEVDPPTLQIALRGLARLREKGVTILAVRGQLDISHSASQMTWHDLLAGEGLLHVLDVGTTEVGVSLAPWDRRANRGSYVDMGRCRVFGMRYLGAMTGAMVGEVADAIAGLDNREMDFRIMLLHASLEHFSQFAGSKLTFGDLLALRTQVDYVALGNCPRSYEADGWAYNPGADGLYHVTVDTAVKPKHIARHVPYPTRFPSPRPLPPPEPTSREELEEAILRRLLDDYLVSAHSTADAKAWQDLLLMTVRSIWASADSHSSTSQMGIHPLDELPGSYLFDRFLEATERIKAPPPTPDVAGTGQQKRRDRHPHS